MILQVLRYDAGWINRHQQQVIVYHLEENRPFTLPGATYHCSF